MSKLFYWQAWERPFKIIFWSLLLLFLALVLIGLVLQFIGTETLLDWHVLTRDLSYIIDYSIFSKGPFSFSITADKKVLEEIFVGGEMPSSVLASKILMVIITLCIMLFLALVTLFKRIWYLIAMAGMLVFLVMLDMGAVQLFGWSDTKALILIFIILLTPSYYLHAFSTNSGFIKRVLVMSIVLALIGGIIYYYSETEYPFTSLLNYGILAPYILIILFIISVAHEIVALFVNIISSTENIVNSTKIKHFLIITSIYITNILLSYLYIAHYIDWQLPYINPFVLLAISAILGVWGSRARAPLYAGASKLEALWPILYLVIAVVSMGTIVFFMLTLNDPFIKVLGDIIIYAHLAVGIAFLLYVLYNFIPLIEKGYEIRKILYNPTNLPYLTYRLMALMIVVGLFAIRGFDYPVWYSMGGYNNAKGDLSYANGYPDVAEAYYATGDAFAYHNHKSNYSLGMMFAGKEPTKAIGYFDKALDQRPTSQTILNKANSQNSLQEYYNALFTLQEGSTLLNDNLHIYNNLALQFNKLKIRDSATYYLELAGTSNKQVRNNRLAHYARYNMPLGKDSAALFSDLDKAGEANASAFGYFNQQPSMINANHMFDMVLLNNWLLTNEPQVQDGSLDAARMMIDSTSDLEYQQQLRYSWSVTAYRAGNITDAIDVLNNLISNSAKWSERALITLGNIYLEAGAYAQAGEIFLELSNNGGSLELAISDLENGNHARAESFWQDAAKVEDEFLSTIALDLLATIYIEEPVLDTDQKRYLFARYQRTSISEEAEIEILLEIENQILRIDLTLDLVNYYHDFVNDHGASILLTNLDELELSTPQYRRYLLLKALIHPDSENVQQQLIEFEKLFSFTPQEYLLESTLNHLAGMTMDSTDYLQMAHDNPFNVDAILNAIHYFNEDEDPFRSYSFLADAAQLNQGSPRLMQAYILKALEVGLEKFAEDALFDFGQRFSKQAYLKLQNEFDIRIEEMRILEESEFMEAETELIE